MVINEASVTAKVNAFMRSRAGKEKIKSTLQRYDTEGRQTTDGGDIIVTEKMLRDLGETFVQFVKYYATFEFFAESVVSSINTIHISGVSKNRSGYTMLLDFDAGSLWRPSLRPDIYGGIYNIVALFNTGYSARATVNGDWHGVRTTSLAWRPASHFLQRAAELFMDETAPLGLDIKIDLDDVYKGTYGGVSGFGPQVSSGSLPS